MSEKSSEVSTSSRRKHQSPKVKEAKRQSGQQMNLQLEMNNMGNSSTLLGVGALVAFALAAVGVSVAGLDLVPTGLAFMAGAAATR